MQASKIRVKSIYAIRDKSGSLKRFRVSSVTQRRIDNTGSPHDYKSYVEGTVEEDNAAGLALHERALIKLDPVDILGPFEEFEELDQRHKAEEAAVKAKNDAFTTANRELRALLYEIVDQQVPNDERDYKQPFRYISGTVDIMPDAVVPLLNALKRLKS